jgi:hypothetical protein
MDSGGLSGPGPTVRRSGTGAFFGRTSITRGQGVRAGYACQDGTSGSGIASRTAPVAAGRPINTKSVGRHSFTVTATSKDGQTTTSTVTYTVGLSDNHFTVSQIKTHRNSAITFTVKTPGPGAIGVLETARRPTSPAPRSCCNPRRGGS